MKNFFLLIAFVLVSTLGFSKEGEKTKETKNTFAHHSGEFHITPSADYMLYQKGTDYKASAPYEFRMPFIGFDLGAQYMYRPCELFGVSTGLDFRMQANYYRHSNYFLGNKFVDQINAGHTGFLQLPIEFHLFKKMEHSTFEFATGPQFNFPLFSKESNTSYLYNGDKSYSSTGVTKYNTTQMREGSTLGWNILLGAQLTLCELSDMFIGPQINFLNLASFNKDISNSQKMYGRFVDCSLGLKLGFRFHCKK